MIKNKYVFWVVFAALTACSFRVVAQQPVDSEFHGEWVFDRAQAQERPLHSKQEYSVRGVSQDEFWQKVYFLNMPTQILFIDKYIAHISHPSWSKLALFVMNDNKLEFRVSKDGLEYKLDIAEIHSYIPLMPNYDVKRNGNQMSLQCEYFYSDGQGNYTEGILTIYYKQY